MSAEDAIRFAQAQKRAGKTELQTAVAMARQTFDGLFRFSDYKILTALNTAFSAEREPRSNAEGAD